MMEAVLCDELTFISLPWGNTSDIGSDTGSYSNSDTDDSSGSTGDDRASFAGKYRRSPAQGPSDSELVHNGRNRRVTETNKKKYVALLVEHFLVGRCRAELALLVEGFFDVLPKAVLRGGCGEGGQGAGNRLNALDLEILVTGLPGLDMAEWKAHAEGSLFETHSAEMVVLAEWFWEVLEEDMDLEQRAKLLAFTCGSSRLPAGGFAALHPHFNVEVTAESVEHLPSAHTCFNQLTVPRYSSREQLSRLLLKALELDAGFGFI
jgi:E3 ubiquitin-protein ligase HUWE1